MNKELHENLITKMVKNYNSLDIKKSFEELEKKYPNSNINHFANKVNDLLEDHKNELEIFLADIEYDLQYQENEETGQLYSDIEQESYCYV